MADILTGAASSAISAISSIGISPLIQLIDDVINLDQNSLLLQDKLRRTKALLQDIANRFERERRSPPDTVKDWVERLQHSPQDAKQVVDRAQMQKRCLDCFLCRPRVSTQVRVWNANFDRLFIDLERDFSTLLSAQGIAPTAPLQSEALLQPVPQSGFVGLGIKSCQMRLQTWLDDEDQRIRIIAVYGMGGIGKTSLLKTIYNDYKKELPGEFVELMAVSAFVSCIEGRREADHSDGQFNYWEGFVCIALRVEPRSVVINETHRLANVAPAVFREAIAEIKIKGGFVIPKGWSVLVLMNGIHLDDDKYHSSPLKFDPWRWQQILENNELYKNPSFMPFGGGLRLCPGMHLAKLELGLFLHHFITKFRWEPLDDDKISYFPVSHLTKGFPIRLHPQEQMDD